MIDPIRIEELRKALSFSDLGVLLLCSPNHPIHWTKKLTKNLIKEGLLALDDGAPTVRTTQLGEDYLAALLNERMRLPYVCVGCAAEGVKLWRQYSTFVDHTRLLCRKCAEADQEVPLIPDGDQIGYLVPAVPTPDGSSFWGYTSVPAYAVIWWKGLPE